MDKLPQELVERISGNLEPQHLKNTLTLSSKFRYAAERSSGAFFEFKLTESNAEKFLTVYSGHRFNYLRRLEFPTKLPALDWAPDVENPPCRENRDQLHEKDEAFTRQIEFLFTTLKTLEERLRVDDHASGVNGPGRIELVVYTPTRSVHPQLCFHHRFVSWRIHLLHAETLPELTSVHSLEVQQGEEPYPSNREDAPSLRLDTRVLIDLAGKLPNLEYLGCELGGDEWLPNRKYMNHFVHDWPGPRRDARHDFATAVENVKLPASLRRARLDFLYPLTDDIDHHQPQPDLVGPALRDPFSSSLRLLSRQLRQLRLHVSADASLFLPADGEVSEAWPNLESLDVMFHPVSPSGAWYFQGPKGEGLDTATTQVTGKSYPPFEETSDDEYWENELEENGMIVDDVFGCQFRIAPVEDRLRPFLLAFAQATAKMPALKYAQLWSPLDWQPWDLLDDNDEYPGIDRLIKQGQEKLAWGVAYQRPGGSAIDTHPGDNHCAARQIWWKVADWRPDAALHDCFRQIGRQQHGEALREYWHDDIYGQCLTDREFFEVLRSYEI